MSELTPDTTIAQIVTEQPSAAALFDQLGIDFCCGGEKSLAEAATAQGLDAQTLITTLDALDAIQGDTAGAHDIKDLSASELIDHIVREHHARVRKESEKIGELLETVVRVHGDGDASLAVLREKFIALAEDLEQHMTVEEGELFPVCLAADTGEDVVVDAELIDALTHDHEDVGVALRELRAIGNDYDQATGHCNTHRFLLQSLQEFDEDLHVHIHEENNVLFPRARTALAAASAK